MELFLDPVALWLIASRLTGWLLISPGFTEINTPQLTRAGIIIWLSFLLLPIIGPVHAHLSTAPDLIVAALIEFAVGAGYGFMLRLIFSAVQFGGVLLDSELGYTYAQQVNPYAATQSGVFNRLFLLLSILYFWIFDYFRVVIAALHQSFILIPLGSLERPVFDIGLFVKLGSALFAGGVTFAAPIIGLIFFVNLSLGFLSRAVQGLHIFGEVFIFKVSAGLLGIFLLLPLFFLLLRVELEKIVPLSSQYFKFTP